MHGRQRPGARVALAGLAATIAVALAAPAVAQAEWSSFAEYERHTDRKPSVAIDAEGNATAVWESGIWRHTTRWQVWTASRPAGGAWSQAELLAPVADVDQQRPELIVAPDGTVTAVWAQGRELNTITPWTGDATVQTAVKPAGGAWQAPTELAAPIAAVGDLDLTVDADGDAVAGWLTSDDTQGYVRVARRPAGGAWQAPQDIPGAIGTSLLDVAVRDGAVAAVWEKNHTVWGGYLPDGGAWDDAEQLSPDYGQKPAVTIDGGGSALAVFNTPGEIDDNAIRWSERTAGGDEWAAAEVLGQGSDPAIASDAQGRVAATWAGHIYVPGGLSRDTQLTFRENGGPWGPTLRQPKGMTSGDDGRRVVLLDERGAVTIAAGSQAFHREPDGTWNRADGYPDGLGSAAPPGMGGSTHPESGATMAVNAAGDLVAAYRFYVTGVNDDRMATLGGDFLGPRLRDLTVPATATVGEPVDVSVDPLDVWSDVASVVWDFGDGGTDDDASASHVWASPGTYDVTVTSTDTFGHVTSETREVVVSEPAARAPEGRAPEGRAPEGRAPEAREPEGRQAEGSGRGGDGPTGGGSTAGGSSPGGGSAPAPAGPSPPPAVADTTAPQVTRIGLTARKATLRLSEPARVRVKVRRCVVKRTRRGARRTVCATAATVAGDLAAGAVSLRLAPRALAVGRYRVTVTATDAAGNASRTSARPSVR